MTVAAAVWAGLQAGSLSCVATDHCAFTTAQKRNGVGNFAKIPNGTGGLEDRLPVQAFIHLDVGFDRDRAMDEDRFRDMIGRHGFSMRDIAYRLHDSPPRLEYRTVIWSNRPDDVRALERSLLVQPEIVHFRIAPSRD